MAIAPQNIMSKLRGMNDQQLAQYAQLHQQDPYIFPLAFQESRNRQHVRAAGQAQMAGQQQPKVVEQDLQQMQPQELPEDVGIGQLPAKNIANMAEGGIVAFGDGGEVPRYQNQGLVRQADVQAAYDEWMASKPSWFQQSTPTSSQREAAAKAKYENLLRQVNTGPNISQPGSTAVTFEMPTSTPSGPSPSNADIENMIGIGSPNKSDAGSKSTAGTGAGPKATTSSGGAGATQGLAGLMKEMQPFLSKDDDKMADRVGFMKEREEVRKPVYEKMTEMIEKEKGKLKDDKEQAFFMSLIEGGLAAAGGSSQYGLQNLAQGFAKGAASFGESLKDIRKAARENSKMEMEATRMQAADKIGDMDAYQRSSEAFQERKAKRDTAMNAAVFGITGDKMRADAQIKAAGIAASAPGAQERLFMALGGGDINKGLERFQAAQADKTGATYAKLYSDYAANADKAGADKMSPVEFAQNLQLFMGSLQGGGFQQAPGQGTVRKLPGT